MLACQFPDRSQREGALALDRIVHTVAGTATDFHRLPLRCLPLTYYRERAKSSHFAGFQFVKLKIHLFELACHSVGFEFQPIDFEFQHANID